MRGIVYLGGGGSSDDESLLWDEVFDGRTRILYLPLALEVGLHRHAAGWLAGNLAKRGTFDLQTWSSLAGKDPAQLGSFDVVFIGGGDTYLLTDQVRDHGFEGPLRDYVASGGTLYGGSAGACLAGTNISVDLDCGQDRPPGSDMSGLGIVGFSIWPHFKAAAADGVRGWLLEHGETLLAIPERAGAVVTDGEIRNVGPESIWLFEPTSERELPAGATASLS